MRIVAAILLFLWPATASAGIKATYLDSGQQIVIEVTDGGEARINGPDPNSYGVIRDGEFYIVGKEEGGWRVARMADVANAFGAVTPQLLKDLFGATSTAATAPARFKVEDKGKRTHLGREGILLAVTDLSDGTEAEPQLFLVSRDEDLKPVGRALEQFTYSFFVLLGGLTGPVLPEPMDKMRSLFALGTPLEIEGGYKLVGLESAQIEAVRVVLPARPQTVDEIKASIKVSPLDQDKRD